MTTKQSPARGGTKTRQQAAEQKVNLLQKELAQLKQREAHARGQWTRGYQRYTQATKSIVTMADRMFQGKHATKNQEARYATHKTLVEQWPARTIELTKTRDEWRAKIAKTEEALSQAKTALAVILTEDAGQARATDEIVNQVFRLNDVVVEALHRRNDFLNQHVFPNLLDSKGNLRRQITFTSTDGLRRVVALVNSITIVDTGLAQKAREQFDLFIGRFQPEMMAEEVRPLYEITKKVLYQKTSFKVGQDFWLFMAMDLDPLIFPELAYAQALLKQSIRSEKTNSYIRLWVRASTAGKWKPLPQS